MRPWSNAGRRFAAAWGLALAAWCILVQGCAASGATATSATGVPGEPPAVVRARCAACHALPVGRPHRGWDAVQRAHRERLRLSREEWAEVDGWLGRAVP